MDRYILYIYIYFVYELENYILKKESTEPVHST